MFKSISQRVEEAENVSIRERDRVLYNASRGLYAKPYNEEEARKSATATAPSKRGPGKWVPKLRYVKDRFGIPSQHSGSNRQRRRVEDAYRRNGYYDQTTGDWVQGSRSRNRQKAREIALIGTNKPLGRPVRRGR